MGNDSEAINIFSTLYQDHEEAVFLCDETGRILYYNEPFYKWYGTPEQVGALSPPLHPEGKSWQAKTVRIGDESFHIYIHRPAAASKLLLRALYSIFDAIDDGVSAIDATGHFILYNHSLEKMEGYKAGEVLGKHVTELYNVDQKTSMLLRSLREGQTIRDYRQHYSMKNNRTFEVIIESAPLRENGKITGAICIYKDYTVFEKMTEKYYFLKEGNAKSPYYIKHDRDSDEQQVQLIGNSPKFMESLRMAATAAASNSAVMLYGETGTGKELFARRIHDQSNRVAKPFIAINCAAIPESLLESLLFGTMKGAFTGAVNSEGLFEQANGGTIFLDEINSMPLALQAKILRVIEEKQVRRLGDKETIPIDVRIISSTNQDINSTVEKGIIRSDLFFRLAVIYIQIPPLREREEDMETLVSFFIRIYNREMKKNIVGVQANVLKGFKAYPWPGNVRQLKNIIECAMNFIDEKESLLQEYHIPRYANILKPKEAKTLELPPEQKQDEDQPFAIIREIKEEERQAIIESLKGTNGNITQAAKRLGISRQSLQYKMKKYHLS